MQMWYIYKGKPFLLSVFLYSPEYPKELTNLNANYTQNAKKCQKASGKLLGGNATLRPAAASMLAKDAVTFCADEK